MRVSQTQPNSPLNELHLQSDQAGFQTLYSALLELKRAGVISDAQKVAIKQRLISNDVSLMTALNGSSHVTGGSVKDRLTRYITQNFPESTPPPRVPLLSSHLPAALEVKTTSNAIKNSARNSSGSNGTSNVSTINNNKVELGQFMKYLDDLQVGSSPLKLTMFDKKQLQKIYKRLQAVVIDQSQQSQQQQNGMSSSSSSFSPLPQTGSSSNNNNNNTSSVQAGSQTNELSPIEKLPLTFVVEDVLYLHQKYKEIKQIYADVQRVSQMFVSDSLVHPNVVKNTKLLLKYLLNVDSFSFVAVYQHSNQKGKQDVTGQQQPATTIPAPVISATNTTNSSNSTNPVEWIFFDSEVQSSIQQQSQQQQQQQSFVSEQLEQEINMLTSNPIELEDLNPVLFPTIRAKFKVSQEDLESEGKAPQKTFIVKFLNEKTETYEVFALRYHSEEAYNASDKVKVLRNQLGIRVYLSKAMSQLGMFLVQTMQQFNYLQESSVAIIDICNNFLNFGKNVLLDIFKDKLEQCFQVEAKLRVIENLPDKQEKNVQERSQLLVDNQLLLEDDYADIIIDCSIAKPHVVSEQLNSPQPQQQEQKHPAAHNRSLFVFFTEIQHYFGKYRSFLAKVNSKVFIYKFFLRSSYQTFLEINKKGNIKFISHVKPHNLELDHSKLEQRSLSINEVFKNNRRFQAEFNEIIDFFAASAEEQERLNMRAHLEEEAEKQRQQRSEQVSMGLPVLHEDDSLSRAQIDQNNQPSSLNSCMSPAEIVDKTTPTLLNASHHLQSTIQQPNRSFVSSASKSYRPMKSYMKRGNMWFHLRSIPDSQIYIEVRSQQNEKLSIGSIYLNIQDDFHSDSFTNFESFNQFDDIFNSLGGSTSEFNDPRIKLILKKIYSKVNSINTEEKVQKEYIDTQIELFTATHRDRLSSNSGGSVKPHNPVAATKLRSAINTTKSSISSMKRQIKQQQQQQQLQQQQSSQQQNQQIPQNITSILHLTPAVTNIDEWNFNVFELRSTEEKYTTAWNILQRSEFAEHCAIPEEVFASFIKELQKGYDVKNNAFHNFNHGLSVMQSCFMLSKCKKATQILKKQDVFSVILSGLCHDVGHTGRTNNFEIAVQSKLAIRYSDKSVLEQHHLATTFQILKSTKQDNNILQNLEPQVYNQVRRAMISNILYTDIKQHFKLKQDFETYWKSFDVLTNDMDKIPEGEMDLLTGMIIHTADFTAAAKPFPLSRQWSEKVNKEFHQQYIEEGKVGVEQTAFMKDLDVIHVMAKAEKGFLNVIVLPLWQSLNDFYQGELQMMIANLNESINSWGELSQQIPSVTNATSTILPQVNEEKKQDGDEKRIEEEEDRDDANANDDSLNSSSSSYSDSHIQLGEEDSVLNAGSEHNIAGAPEPIEEAEHEESPDNSPILPARQLAMP